jgi:hypothetical protein
MPGIWEYPPLRALTRWRDLFGSAGFLGFTEGRSEYFTQAIVRGCHGAALVNTNQPSIHEFILRGKETDPNPKADESASATVALLLSVAGLALLVTIGVYLWPHGIGVMAAYLATILLILVYF